MEAGQGSGTAILSSDRATMMFARLAFAGTVFMAMVLFTMGSDNPLNPCGNIAHAQSTICNVASNHTFDAGVSVNDDGGATATDDFRVESDTDENLIDTDAAGENVAFGQDASTNDFPFQVVDAAGFGSTVTITGSLSLVVDLPVSEGGTGASSFTDHGVMLGSGSGDLSVTAAGTSGQVLTSNGSGSDPTYQTTSGTSISTGTYTGDSSDPQTISGLGITPELCSAVRADGNEFRSTWTETDAAGLAFTYAAADTQDRIASLASGSFDVSSFLNTSATTYYFWCIGS